MRLGTVNKINKRMLFTLYELDLKKKKNFLQINRG